MRGGAAVAAIALAVSGLIGCGSKPSVERSGRTGDATDSDATRCGDGAVVLAFSDPAKVGNEEGGDVFVLDAAGDVRQLSDDGGSYSPAVSPDGTEVAVASIGETGEVSDSFGPSHLELFVEPVDGGLRRAVGTSGFGTDPSWSPDGSRIAFARSLDEGYAGDQSEVWVISADGGGQHRLVDPLASSDDIDPAWSPDGNRVAFVRATRAVDNRTNQLMVAELVDGSTSDVTTLIKSDHQLSEPAWSPDGRQLAVRELGGDLGGGYGTVEVLDAADGAEVTSIESSASPSWTSDGRLLAYGRAPGTSDASSGWRVAEMVPRGDGGYAAGLPVPGIDPVGFLYGSYRVSGAPCKVGDAPLTAAVQPLATASVTVPSTGVEVTVLARKVVEGTFDQQMSAPTGRVTAKLVEPSVLHEPSTPSAIEGEPPAPERPLLLPSESPPLVWVVCDAGICEVVDAETGNRLVAGGNLRDGFDDLEDLAPS